MTIDFNTCTPRDVIERSALLHPSLFVERLREAALIHSQFAARTHDRTAASAALKLAYDCRTAADNVRDERCDLICRTLGQLIPAFQVACDLQLVPRHCREGIMARADSIPALQA
jgi:hypothetical protein